jgi:hypothetical protein
MKSVSQSLIDSMKTEVFDGDNMYFCSNCKSKQVLFSVLYLFSSWFSFLVVLSVFHVCFSGNLMMTHDYSFFIT